MCQLFKESDFIKDKKDAKTLNAKTQDRSGFIEFKNVYFAYHDRNNHANSSLTESDQDKKNKDKNSDLSLNQDKIALCSKISISKDEVSMIDENISKFNSESFQNGAEEIMSECLNNESKN